MRFATYNVIVLGIGLLACLLAIAGGVLYTNIRTLYEDASWVTHTHEVAASLENLFSDITDAEVWKRDYIITGREQFLKSFEEAVANYHSEVDRVTSLTADNPRQQERIPRLKELVETRFSRMERILALQREQGPDAAREALADDEGHRQMSDIRQAIDQLRQEERSLLPERAAAAQAAYRTAAANTVVTIAVGLAALAALWFGLRRYLQATERTNAVIHQQRELLQAMLISIGDGVIATDAEGKVTLLNSVAERLTGWMQAEATGRPLTEVFRIVNEQTGAEADNPAARALREGRIVGLANHTVLIAKNGMRWPLDDSAAPICTASGHIEGAILVFREISERKRQEQQLLAHAAELKEADHRKDEFLATLAHELRNPLSPISNALQVWPFVEDDREERERLRAVMDRQVRQMTRLIDDLMDVSRITRGKLKLQRQRVDLVTLIHEAIESVKPLVDASGQQLTLALPSQPLYVDGDVARLTQALSNILNNAAKYTGRGGTIWVSLAVRDARAQISVRDNGPGIPEHMLEAIFEMFRQVDGSLHRAHGGLGIGLTLVKQLVQDHGGTVEAVSAGPGQGSEFIVTLPLSSSHEDSQGSSSLEQIRPASARRILVVDDIRASAQTLAMLLKTLGHQVAEAYDGPSAIKWALENKPDVVLLDIAMPGMSGYEVAQRLQQELPEAVLVAVTGYGQDEDRRQSREAGFCHHMVKPIDVEALHRLLVGLPRKEASTKSGNAS